MPCTKKKRFLLETATQWDYAMLHLCTTLSRQEKVLTSKKTTCPHLTCPTHPPSFTKFDRSITLVQNRIFKGDRVQCAWKTEKLWHPLLLEGIPDNWYLYRAAVMMLTWQRAGKMVCCFMERKVKNCFSERLQVVVML